MKLGSRVKAWRETQGWSLEGLGQKAGVDKQVIWALEHRNSSKSVHGPSIARAFGITYEQLLDPSVLPWKVVAHGDACNSALEQPKAQAKQAAMLHGKELGSAIRVAYELKRQSGGVDSIADVAKHFGIKAPSVHDWFKRGSISKEKLPELWSYFSDVVGPEHWGMDSWPVKRSSESLGALRATINQLPTGLQTSAKALLLQWINDAISTEDAATALDSLVVASKALRDVEIAPQGHQ